MFVRHQSLRGVSCQAVIKCMYELVRLHMMQSDLAQSLMWRSVMSHGMLHIHAGQALTEGPFCPVASLARQVPNQCLARGLPDALAHPAQALTSSHRCAALQAKHAKNTSNWILPLVTKQVQRKPR